MQIQKVRLDGQLFLLDPTQDVTRTKAAIVEAARNGSDFVDFMTVGHGTVSLLVTPNLPIWFEVIEKTPDELHELQQHPVHTDSWSSNYDF